MDNKEYRTALESIQLDFRQKLGYSLLSLYAKVLYDFFSVLYIKFFFCIH